MISSCDLSHDALESALRRGDARSARTPAFADENVDHCATRFHSENRRPMDQFGALGADRRFIRRLRPGPST